MYCPVRGSGTGERAVIRTVIRVGLLIESATNIVSAVPSPSASLLMESARIT